MSKRVKINFETVNKNMEVTIIPHEVVTETNERIRKAMKKFHRKHRMRKINR